SGRWGWASSWRPTDRGAHRPPRGADSGRRLSMAGNGLRIVDADGHVLEPPTGMAERAPARFRDRIGQIVVRPDGTEWLRYNGHERPTRGMALAGAGGMSAEDRDRARRGEIRYSDIRSGAFEPLPRLRDMDLDHIGQSVLYPTMLLGLPSLTAHEFPEVQADAYNPWLADCGARRPRRRFAVRSGPP